MGQELILEEFEQSEESKSDFLFYRKDILEHQGYLLSGYKLRRDENILARIIFSKNEQILESIGRAPYGGIERLDEGVKKEHIKYFISCFTEKKLKRNASQLIIRQSPWYDDAFSETIHEAFLEAGYELRFKDINYHIPIEERYFSNKLHQSHRRKLKKAGEKLIIKPLDSADASKVYDFILKCREQKGYPMTLDKVDFIKLCTGWPGDYLLFGAYAEDELAGVSVVVRISSKVLYHFYPAHDEKYDAYSPVILLTNHLFNYALENGYEILDLGIATERGEPNKGLMQFKERLGALPSEKYTYIYTA